MSLCLGGRDCYTIYEFFYPSNVNILHQYPVCCKKPIGKNEEPLSWSKRPSSKFFDKSAHLVPRYAAGRVFIPSLLGGLFAQAYSTPGILELAEVRNTPILVPISLFTWFITTDICPPVASLGHGYALPSKATDIPMANTMSTRVLWPTIFLLGVILPR